MKIALALPVLLLLVASGCVKESFAEVRPETITGTTYTHPDHGFSITVPREWEVNDSGFFGTAVMFLSPRGEGDAFQENVNVVVEKLPRNMTAEEYSNAAIGTMERIITDFKLLDSGRELIGGEEAFGGIYSMRLGKIRTKNIYYAIVQGRRAYVITCAAHPDTFNQYKGVLSGIAKTFRVR